MTLLFAGVVCSDTKDCMSLPVLPGEPAKVSHLAAGGGDAKGRRELFQGQAEGQVQAWSVHGQIHALQIFMMLSTLVMMFHNAVAGEQIYHAASEAANDNQRSSLRLSIRKDLSLETRNCLGILHDTLVGLKLSVDDMALFRFMMTTVFFAPDYFFAKELDQTLNKAQREAEMIKHLLEALLDGPIRVAWEEANAKISNTKRVPRQAQLRFLKDAEATFRPHIEGVKISLPARTPGPGPDKKDPSQKLALHLAIVRQSEPMAAVEGADADADAEAEAEVEAEVEVEAEAEAEAAKAAAKAEAAKAAAKAEAEAEEEALYEVLANAALDSKRKRDGKPADPADSDKPKKKPCQNRKKVAAPPAARKDEQQNEKELAKKRRGTQKDKRGGPSSASSSSPSAARQLPQFLPLPPPPQLPPPPLSPPAAAAAETAPMTEEAEAVYTACGELKLQLQSLVSSHVASLSRSHRIALAQRLFETAAATKNAAQRLSAAAAGDEDGMDEDDDDDDDDEEEEEEDEEN